LARLTFTQRTIDVLLGTKPKEIRDGKRIPIAINTVGELLVASRKEAGLTQRDGTKSGNFQKVGRPLGTRASDPQSEAMGEIGNLFESPA
jgi:hypothetical protein